MRSRSRSPSRSRSRSRSSSRRRSRVIDNLHREIDELQDKVRRREKTIDNLEQDKELERKDKWDAKERAREAQKKAERLQKEYDEGQQKNAALTAQLEKLRGESDGLRARVHQLEVEVAELKVRGRKGEEIEGQRDAAMKEIEGVKAQLRRREKEEADARSKIQAGMRQREVMFVGKIDQYSRSIARLNNNIAARDQARATAAKVFDQLFPLLPPSSDIQEKARELQQLLTSHQQAPALTNDDNMLILDRLTSDLRYVVEHSQLPVNGPTELEEGEGKTNGTTTDGEDSSVSGAPMPSDIEVNGGNNSGSSNPASPIPSTFQLLTPESAERIKPRWGKGLVKNKQGHSQRSPTPSEPSSSPQEQQEHEPLPPQPQEAVVPVKEEPPKEEEEKERVEVSGKEVIPTPNTITPTTTTTTATATASINIDANVSVKPQVITDDSTSSSSSSSNNAGKKRGRKWEEVNSKAGAAHVEISAEPKKQQRNSKQRQRQNAGVRKKEEPRDGQVRDEVKLNEQGRNEVELNGVEKQVEGGGMPEGEGRGRAEEVVGVEEAHPAKRRAVQEPKPGVVTPVEDVIREVKTETVAMEVVAVEQVAGAQTEPDVVEVQQAAGAQQQAEAEVVAVQKQAEAQVPAVVSVDVKSEAHAVVKHEHGCEPLLVFNDHSHDMPGHLHGDDLFEEMSMLDNMLSPFDLEITHLMT